ncbi:hypothetical protein ACFODO_13950 [Acinetobacter sichuanensis]|uniref:Uncharacterized protein n=1 Tax=Acinetobacter sichuanensis TaxID=2136183 RepID=A0A371YJZ5_9GAMM|nr:hypothetical protein [Acinetobacter sichuanensis]RFC81770.1 hypothetical protein C9E89_020090 [Acinetobacter sichuanensis]
MGIKKLVTITVEAVIEIELPEWASNPTSKDLNDIQACGFDVENSNDIYQKAAELILLGFDDCNNDVFGFIYPSWSKRTMEDSEKKSFFDLRDRYVEDCEVETMEQLK